MSETLEDNHSRRIAALEEAVKLLTAALVREAGMDVASQVISKIEIAKNPDLAKST